ncbi:hypothetical protein A5634_25895 [Mycobacterium asiaticum]|uniref:SPW repeat-containing integral membrane domain-containing protein n=1 Tax=Mycobacterium asiaticum TaxID=1790 RepID=A0A1A3NXQ3_MYCAS|nr:hypothetical protein A5634_25895 [Mycobacterium asiaticum]
MVADFAVSSTQLGKGFVFGFGAFILFFGVLTVLARDRTPDLWGLFVTGLVMVIVPFLAGGFVGDAGASWVSWVAGGLAMVLGAIGWLGDKTPSETDADDNGAGRGLRRPLGFWLGRSALVVGLATVVMGVVARTTAAGTAVTIGLGTLIALIAVWSLLADDPTHDFLTLAVSGLALFLVPWIVGFAGDGAAWTAWLAGAAATALGVAGYLRSQQLDFSTAVDDRAKARYRSRHR